MNKTKNYKFIRILSLTVVSSITGFYIGSRIKIAAVPLEGNHAYIQQSFNGSNNGGHATLSLGQEDLISTSSATNKIGSINKEMWVILELFGACWIEVGQKKGAQVKDLSQPDDDELAQTINWVGHFMGFKLFNTSKQTWEFHGAPYGTGSPTGQHTYQIKLTNPNTGEWKIFVNGIQALTLAGSYCAGNSAPKPFLITKSVGITVGIESKDTSNSFKNGTYISNWQFLDPIDSKWKLVKSAENKDVNVYNGMKSTFTYSDSPSPNNKVVFTRN